MNKVEAITSFTRNSAKYGISVKEASILIAVAQICGHKEAHGLPAEATQVEINLITGMEMRSTISRLSFWIEQKRKKTGKIQQSYYWLNAKGIEAVKNLLALQPQDMEEIIKQAKITK